MALVQRRIGLLFALFFGLLALAAGRTLWLGAVRSHQLQQAADDQHISTFTVPAVRGSIADRDGVYLAVSVPADDVSADPLLLTDKTVDPAARHLAPLLGESEQQLLSLLREPRGFVYLAHASSRTRGLSGSPRCTSPGINLTLTARRVYPRNTVAAMAQVLVTVGTEGHGLAGLEFSLDSRLHGSSGERRVVSDARGQPISIHDLRSEQPGANVALTLDANIQQRTEDVLAAVGQIYHPQDATAIVMNPNTGALLAVANWPPANANDSAAAASTAFEDRAVGFTYEPGSTFKVVAIAGALEEGLVTPQTSFFLQPQIQVADRTIHDAEPRPAESLTVSQILAHSDNVGAITIGERLGATRFDEWVRRFGFGRPTGVDLPGDEQGIVPTLAEYSGSSMGNLPIGQGESVTPLQIATAYSAIANGGILRPPHVVSARRGLGACAAAGRPPHHVGADGGRAAPDAARRARTRWHGERGLDPRL